MRHVRYVETNGVAEIVLDRPPVNALTDGMVADLIAALDRAAGDPAVRAVILGSAVPQRFCAGLDLAALERATAEEIRALLDKLYAGIWDAQLKLGKPSIAAVGLMRSAGGWAKEKVL